VAGGAEGTYDSKVAALVGEEAHSLPGQDRGVSEVAVSTISSWETASAA
jgi:hypothetical protein